MAKRTTRKQIFLSTPLHPHEWWFLRVVIAGSKPKTRAVVRAKSGQPKPVPPGRGFGHTTRAICPVCGKDAEPGWCLSCEVHADPECEGLFPSVAAAARAIREAGYTDHRGVRTGPWTDRDYQIRSGESGEPFTLDPINGRLFYDNGGFDDFGIS